MLDIRFLWVELSECDREECFNCESQFVIEICLWKWIIFIYIVCYSISFFVFFSSQSASHFTRCVFVLVRLWISFDMIRSSMRAFLFYFLLSLLLLLAIVAHCIGVYDSKCDTLFPLFCLTLDGLWPSLGHCAALSSLRLSLPASSDELMFSVEIRINTQLHSRKRRPKHRSPSPENIFIYEFFNKINKNLILYLIAIYLVTTSSTFSHWLWWFFFGEMPENQTHHPSYTHSRHSIMRLRRSYRIGRSIECVELSSIYRNSSYRASPVYSERSFGEQTDHTSFIFGRRCSQRFRECVIMGIYDKNLEKKIDCSSFHSKRYASPSILLRLSAPFSHLLFDCLLNLIKTNNLDNEGI